MGDSLPRRMVFEAADSVSEDILPSVRPRISPLSELLDDSILSRLKELAYRRKVASRTLLNQLVVERLDEEEKGEGALSTVREENQGRRTELAEEPRKETKPRDWQSWAYSYVQENEGLLSDPDIDPITLSSLAQDSSGRLLELSGEIKKASATRGYPATQLRRMIKGYDRLKTLAKGALELYAKKFDESGEEIEEMERVREEAESNVVPFRRRA